MNREVLKKNNEINLPMGWVSLTLTDIVKNDKNAIKRGPFGSSIKKEFFITSGYKVYEQKNAIYNNFELGSYFIGEKKFDELKDFELRSGDIIISCSGTIGKIGIVPQKFQRGIINQALLKISLNEEIATKEYFVNLLKSRLIQQKVLGDARGSALQNLASVKSLKQILFPIPPINEQKRIASKIEELIQQCNSTKLVIKKTRDLLKQFRSSMLVSAFKGNLVPQNSSDESAEVLLSKISENIKSLQKIDNKKKKFENVEHSALPSNFIEQCDLPKGWCWTRIENISIVVRGASPRPAGDPKYFGGKIPWITVGSITRDENIYLTDVSEFVTEEGCIKSRYVEPETLLLTNSGATLGVPKITKIGGCINDGSVALLNVHNPLKTYLYYYLLSLTKKLRSINQGAAQPNLNAGIVKSIMVPLAPEKEQIRIISKLEEMFSRQTQMNRIMEEIEKRIDAINHVIFEKAFNGELVPQDPNDESVETLLQKIKQEKEKLHQIQKINKTKSFKSRRAKNVN